MRYGGLRDACEKWTVVEEERQKKIKVCLKVQDDWITAKVWFLKYFWGEENKSEWALSVREIQNPDVGDDLMLLVRDQCTDQPP